MKRLKKNQRMTVQAYACACPDPSACVAACQGNTAAMSSSAGEYGRMASTIAAAV